MGNLTRAQLMAHAGLAAGNTEAASFVRTWLDTWLQRTAKSWTWPLLKTRVADVAVPAGTSSLIVGNGEANVTRKIHRLLNGVVFWRVQSGYSPNGRMLIRPFASTDPTKDLNVSDPTKRRGYPSTVRIYTGVDAEHGTLTLVFDPIPVVALYISFDIHFIPADLGATEGADTSRPWYPNDRTLIQACKCAILELDARGERSEHYDAESAKLGAMVTDDRDFDGEQAGDNQLMGLDPSVFRQRT